MLAWLRRWLRVWQQPRPWLYLLAGLALLAGLGYVPARLLWAQRRWRAAELAYQRRAWEAARADLAAYLSVHPNDVAARLQSARVARRAGFLDEARVQLDIVDALHSLDPATALERHLVNTSEGDLAAESHLWRLVDARHAQAVPILEALERAYRKNYLLGRMERALNVLLELQPDHVDAYLSRAWIHERRLQYERALQDCEQALALQPAHFGARLAKAQTLLKMAKPRDAVPELGDLYRQRQGDARVALGWFQALFKTGAVDEARAVDQELAARFADDVPILTERGRFYLELGQADAAAQVLQAAAAAAPFDYHVHFALQQALHLQGRDHEAQATRVRLKQLETDLNQMSELTEKLQAAPFDPDLRSAIARIFLRSGETKEGLAWLKTVLRIDPRHAPTHRALAEYYEQTRQPALADHHRKLAGNANR